MSPHRNVFVEVLALMLVALVPLGLPMLYALGRGGPTYGEPDAVVEPAVAVQELGIDEYWIHREGTRATVRLVADGQEVGVVNIRYDGTSERATLKMGDCEELAGADPSDDEVRRRLLARVLSDPALRPRRLPPPPDAPLSWARVAAAHA